MSIPCDVEISLDQVVDLPEDYNEKHRLDLLKEDKAASCDVILISTPTLVVPEEQPVDIQNYEGAIFRTDRFLYELISESARCLTIQKCTQPKIKDRK